MAGMIDYTLAQALVSIEHVSLTLDGKVILRDVNAEIRDIERADCAQGQIVCFLGHLELGKHGSAGSSPDLTRQRPAGS